MSIVKSEKQSYLKTFLTLFFSVFLILQIAPMLARFFLGAANVDIFYYPSFLVQNYILGLHDTPVWTHEVSGGADTLDDWAQQLAYVLISLLVTVVWIALGRKGTQYMTFYRFTRIAVRYFLGSTMFLYGIQKLFLLQMVYPKLSYFYTPLGDFKPMDLAWTFVGYSAAHQFIGGLLEFIAGLLLFFRRTLVTGLLIFLGVMANVLMLNYLYGVAVKTFSTTLFLMGLFLLMEHLPRIIDFLLGRKAAKIEIKEMTLTTPWKRKARVVLKYGYILFGMTWIIIAQIQLNSRVNSFTPIPIEGAYDVHSFRVNGKANTNYFDARRWNQVVINRSLDGHSSSGHVALGTTKRELATFEIDSLDRLKITFAKDPSTVFKGVHTLTDDSLVWTGTIGKDSTTIVLRRNEREITLRDSPFRLIMKAGEQENLRVRN